MFVSDEYSGMEITVKRYGYNNGIFETYTPEYVPSDDTRAPIRYMY